MAALSRPTPERRRRLAAVAEAHHEWTLEQLQRTDVQFRSRGADSDYNLHYLDVEADGPAEDRLQELTEQKLRAL